MLIETLKIDNHTFKRGGNWNPSSKKESEMRRKLVESNILFWPKMPIAGSNFRMRKTLIQRLLLRGYILKGNIGPLTPQSV